MFKTVTLTCDFELNSIPQQVNGFGLDFLLIMAVIQASMAQVGLGDSECYTFARRVSLHSEGAWCLL